MTTIDVAAFRQRLAEAIAWCAPRASIDDPKNCPRTPALRSADWQEYNAESNSFAEAGFDVFQSVAERQAVVGEAADRRARQLRLQGDYPLDLTNDLGRCAAHVPAAGGWSAGTGK